MNLEQLKDKKVAVLGLGIEGLALADFLFDKVDEITLLDKLTKEELESRASDESDNKLENILINDKFQFSLGSNYLDNLDKFDIIFRSPGIPYLNPKIQKAKKNGVQIYSQIKLFFDLCPCRIIGVTGTKGKGTTSSLIALMMKKSEIRNLKSEIMIYLAGNIGKPAITLINEISKNDIVVLELSSFQLQDLEKSPQIAVVLNISIDHLNYHKNELEYHQAKENIVKYQTKNDFAVINQDYLISFKFAAETLAEVYYFSAKESVDQGAYVRQCQKYGNKNLYEVALRMDNKEEVVCQSDEIQLIGKHNLENIAAASVVAKIAGADIESIRLAAKEFKGLSHRLEFVAEIKGVKFFDDSFATNPAPTIAAINSFTEPIHLILGGSSKGANFSEMANLIKVSSVSSVNLIGVEAEKIAKVIKESGYEKELSRLSGDINNIVNEVAKKAKSGDIVLFSPACASFDMFKNYKDRGDKFKQAVLLLK